MKTIEEIETAAWECATANTGPFTSDGPPLWPLRDVHAAIRDVYKRAWLLSRTEALDEAAFAIGQYRRLDKYGSREEAQGYLVNAESIVRKLME